MSVQRMSAHVTQRLRAAVSMAGPRMIEQWCMRHRRLCKGDTRAQICSAGITCPWFYQRLQWHEGRPTTCPMRTSPGRCTCSAQMSRRAVRMHAYARSCSSHCLWRSGIHNDGCYMCEQHICLEERGGCCGIGRISWQGMWRDTITAKPGAQLQTSTPGRRRQSCMRG